MFWRKKEAPVAKDAWLIVGLGNPGAKYEMTRHNVGQMALDVLADGTKFVQHKTNSRVATLRPQIPGPQFVLIKPNSFMNLSGGPTSQAAKYFGITPERIIVLHDELDIPFGSLKIKRGGGHGGHNGLRDIAKALDTPDFIRLRIGIGRPPGRQDPADYVLSAFSASERKELDLLLQEAADAATAIAIDGLLSAQQEVHSRNKA